MKNIAFTALTLSLFLIGSSSFGQCFVPLINQNASIAETEHEISWVPNSFAESFCVQYRQLNINAEWNSVYGITGNNLLITDLLPCTNYEFQVRMICESDSSDFSNLTIFQTLGCDACLNSFYCIPNDINYYGGSMIRRVQIGTLDNDTGDSQDGWNYLHLSGSINMGEGYQVYLTPNFLGLSGSASIFIDWNQDGDFYDAQEYVWNFGNLGMGNSTFNTPLLFVPNTALSGCTRLRIMHSYSSNSNPCNVNLPSMEDYCLCINQGIPTGIEPLSESGLNLYPNPTTDNLTIDFEEKSFDNSANSQLLLYNNMGQIVLTKSLQHSRTSLYLGFLPPGHYHALVLQDEKPLLRKPVIISK
jgi:hypothetical protein